MSVPIAHTDAAKVRPRQAGASVMIEKFTGVRLGPEL